MRNVVPSGLVNSFGAARQVIGCPILNGKEDATMSRPMVNIATGHDGHISEDFYVQCVCLITTAVVCR